MIRHSFAALCVLSSVALLACGDSGTGGSGGSSSGGSASGGESSGGGGAGGSNVGGQGGAGGGVDLCGNGMVDAGEACDGADLAGSDCAELGFDGGTLACSANCSYDTSACVRETCGDGVINGTEDCDGAQLGGATCASEGFDGGTLACTAGSCAFDTSGCGDEQCTDGVDNDFDTQIDCLDGNCLTACANACSFVPTLADPSTTTGTTSGHADVVDSACSTGGEVVYQVTPTTTGVLDITLTSATNQGVAVWTACGTGEIDCADSFGGGTDETLTVAVTMGTPVFISVEAAAPGQEGAFSIDVDSRAIACGDNITDPGEGCDDGNTMTEACAYGQTSCMVCHAMCNLVAGATSYCGDSMIDGGNGEGCDDGNTVTEACTYGQTSCMVCNNNCDMVAGATSFCGDNVTDGANGETCDDGNTNPNDGCSATCTLECQPAQFTTSGPAPECWCAQSTSVTTVTVAGWAEVINNASTSLNAGCNSCAPYTTSVVFLPVGTYNLTSQAVPCTCAPSSLVLNGVFAVQGVCGP